MAVQTPLADKSPVAPAIPTFSAAQLAQAGRALPATFAVTLAEGGELRIDAVLRLLPGRRIVAVARWQGKTVLAKLFIDARRATSDLAAEQNGITALTTCGITTPALLAAHALDSGGGQVLLSEYLVGARSLLDLDAATSARYLPQVFALLGTVHAQGLAHHDLHLGNFLCANARLYLVDGDAVDARHAGAPLPATLASANLALLCAQLPGAQRQQLLPELLAAWQGAATGIRLDATALARDIAHAARRRERLFLRKCLRDCSQFLVRRTATRFLAVERSAAPWLATLLDDPDAALVQGELLKDGGTCTVAKLAVGERSVVIKRYNIKGWAHALSRLWRPSRASRSWRAGQLLRFLGIATPRPLALIEERCGPLRRRAWLISEYCPGKDLTRLLSEDAPSADAPTEAIIGATRSVLGQLVAERISHGDLKASNLLWHDGKIWLIDLDSLCRHARASTFARAWARDRARFLRNWVLQPALAARFAHDLPPGQTRR